MRHPDSERLSALLDGDLGDQELKELQEHLGRCPECQALLEDLSSLQQMARGLPEREPAHDLWPGISRAIRRDPSRDPEVIRLYPKVSEPAGPARPAFRLSPLQAVAAGVVLALFSGALGMRMGMASAPDQVPVEVADASWVSLVSNASPQLEGSAREVARLESFLEAHRGELDPQTVRILEKNLGVIDQAIRESVAALRDDPGNQFLETHLERAIEAKGQYLRTAASFLAPAS